MLKPHSIVMSTTDLSFFIRPDRLLRKLALRAGQTVVHLGCGAGFYLIPAARIVGKTGKVIGVDVMPEMLAEAESRARRSSVFGIIQTIHANLETVNGSTLPDQMADVTLVANILHQSQPERILAEAVRITKADGRIIIIEWDVVATPFGPLPSSRISKTEAVKVITAMQWVVTKEFQPSPYHYGLIVSRQT